MEIKIPFKTPTINHLHGRNKFGAVYLKPEAKKLKEEIKKIVWMDISFVIPNLNDGLKVSIEIHENWFTKKGDVKRKDVSNREKFLVDAVFDAMGIDDKFIFEQTMKKVQDTEEYAIIKIEAMDCQRLIRGEYNK